MADAPEHEPDPAPTPSRPRPRRGRWVWRAAGVLCVGLIGWIGWRFISLERTRRSGESELASVRAEVDRTDPDWTWERLNAARKHPPEGKNGAELLPLIGNRLSPEWAKASTKEDWKEEVDIPPNVRHAPRVVEPMRRDLAAAADAVALARKLKDCPFGRRVVVLTPDVLETLQPDTCFPAVVFDLLRRDAAIAVEDGDARRAADAVLALLGSARSIGDEPFIICQLLRMSAGTEAVLAAERLLAQTPAVPGLPDIQAALATEAEEPLLLYGARGARAPRQPLRGVRVRRGPYRRSGGGRPLQEAVEPAREVELSRATAGRPGVRTYIPDEVRRTGTTPDSRAARPGRRDSEADSGRAERDVRRVDAVDARGGRAALALDGTVALRRRRRGLRAVPAGERPLAGCPDPTRTGVPAGSAAGPVRRSPGAVREIGRGGGRVLVRQAPPRLVRVGRAGRGRFPQWGSDRLPPVERGPAPPAATRPAPTRTRGPAVSATAPDTEDEFAPLEPDRPASDFRAGDAPGVGIGYRVWVPARRGDRSEANQEGKRP